MRLLKARRVSTPMGLKGHKTYAGLVGEYEGEICIEAEMQLSKLIDAAVAMTPEEQRMQTRQVSLKPITDIWGTSFFQTIDQKKAAKLQAELDKTNFPQDSFDLKDLMMKGSKDYRMLNEAGRLFIYLGLIFQHELSAVERYVEGKMESHPNAVVVAAMNRAVSQFLSSNLRHTAGLASVVMTSSMGSGPLNQSTSKSALFAHIETRLGDCISDLKDTKPSGGPRTGGRANDNSNRGDAINNGNRNLPQPAPKRKPNNPGGRPDKPRKQPWNHGGTPCGGGYPSNEQYQQFMMQQMMMQGGGFGGHGGSYGAQRQNDNQPNNPSNAQNRGTTNTGPSQQQGQRK
jgi:hypothetical protein